MKTLAFDPAAHLTDAARVTPADTADAGLANPGGDLLEHHHSCCCTSCCGARDADTGTTTSAGKDAPMGKMSEIATYLITGYWNTGFGDGTRSFDLGATGLYANNGVLQYNLSGNSRDVDGLTAPRAELVREVFKLYGATLGINFVETTSTDTKVVDFLIRDNDSGAYASTFYANSGQWGSSITYASVNIDKNWDKGRVNYDSYALQTVLHEIGHALGLGHAGGYNGSATFGVDNTFANDSWQASVMSYFPQNAVPAVKASREFVQTPMTADWLALDKLYGRQGFGTANSFTKDTVWGFNTTVTSDVSDIWATWSQWGRYAAVTIVDGGGTDTLDLSGYSNNSLISLAPTDPNSTAPSASNIGGSVGNLTLAAGTIIENAIGGAGSETFWGNAADNVLIGNGGDDTFHDSSGADTYHGGSGNDYVIFGASYTDYTYQLHNGVLLVNGAAIDRVNSDVEWLKFSDRTIGWQSVVDDIDPGPPVVEEPNTAPVAADDLFQFKPGETMAGSVLSNDSDAEGDTLTVTALNGYASAVGNRAILASGATLSLKSDGTFVYDTNGAFDGLAAGQIGSDRFRYTISDGQGGTDTALVMLSVQGDVVETALAAEDDKFELSPGDRFAGSVLANDMGSGVLSVTELNGYASAVGNRAILASGATVSLKADGTFVYDTNNAFEGLAEGKSASDRFRYTISDGQGETDTALVILTVRAGGANQAPEAKDDLFDLVAGGSVSGSVLGNDNDADRDALSVTELNGYGSAMGSRAILASGAAVSLQRDGTFVYDTNGAFDGLAAGQTATDRFRYTVSDGHGGTDIAKVILTVQSPSGPAIADPAPDDLGANPVGSADDLLI